MEETWSRWILGRLTRLIRFDRHNRFDHHDFRVMVAGTSTVWAFYVKWRSQRGCVADRLLRNIFHPVQIGCELACSQQLRSGKRYTSSSRSPNLVAVTGRNLCCSEPSCWLQHFLRWFVD